MEKWRCRQTQEEETRKTQIVALLFFPVHMDVPDRCISKIWKKVKVKEWEETREEQKRRILEGVGLGLVGLPGRAWAKVISLPFWNSNWPQDWRRLRRRRLRELPRKRLKPRRRLRRRTAQQEVEFQCPKDDVIFHLRWSGGCFFFCGQVQWQRETWLKDFKGFRDFYIWRLAVWLWISVCKIGLRKAGDAHGFFLVFLLFIKSDYMWCKEDWVEWYAVVISI